MIDDPRKAANFTEVLDQETFLGPARVVASRARRLEAELPDGSIVNPQLALAWPTPLEKDDTVLLVGRQSNYFVIGVLASSGRKKLRFFGDVLLHAIGGKLELKSDKEVAIRSSEISIEAGKLRTLAGSVVERANTVYQQVREVLTVHAGEKREIVRGEWMARAKRANIMTSKTISINGKEIHLG